MIEDRSIPDTGLFAPSTMNSGHRAAHLEPAPLGETLQKQLAYLIAHASHPCGPAAPSAPASSGWYLNSCCPSVAIDGSVPSAMQRNRARLKWQACPFSGGAAND